MPKKNIPGYLRHPSGQAYCRIRGKFIYLGRYNSKNSRERYEEVIAEYLANGKKLPPTKSQEDTTILELAIAFLEHAEEYYPPKKGKMNGEFWRCKKALAPLTKRYGNIAVAEFTPLSLKTIRDDWVAEGIARQTINKFVRAIKEAFKWGVTYGLCDVETHYKLSLVPNLKKGHTSAPEYDEIKPVPEEVVRQTLPFMSPVVADMVRLHMFTGMRCQDVRNIRSCDIDQKEDVWRYSPAEHKTAHLNKVRNVAIGPKAQNLLIAYLFDKQDKPEAFLFSPADAEQARKFEAREKRQSKITPSQQQRNTERKKNPQRKFNEQYTKDNYNRAITRACHLAGTTTTITGLSENVKHEFQVRSVTDGKCSSWSPSIFVVTDCTASTPVRRRIFRSTAKTTNSVTLVWPYIKDASYEIQYRQVDDTTWIHVEIPLFPEWSPGQLRHLCAQTVRDRWRAIPSATQSSRMVFSESGVNSATAILP